MLNSILTNLDCLRRVTSELYDGVALTSQPPLLDDIPFDLKIPARGKKIPSRRYLRVYLKDVRRRMHEEMKANGSYEAMQAARDDMIIFGTGCIRIEQDGKAQHVPFPGEFYSPEHRAETQNQENDDE